MAIDVAKSLKRVPPPLQDPMVDPQTGRLTPAWANYFVRLPLTFEDSSSRLDVAESSISNVEAQAGELEAKQTALVDLTWEQILTVELMRG